MKTQIKLGDRLCRECGAPLSFIAIVAFGLIAWVLFSGLARPQEVIEKIRWHQPPDYADPVEHWDFRYTFNHVDWFTPIVVGFPGPCIQCFEAEVVVPDGGAYFQLRAVSVGGRVSDWSNGRPVPEPAVATSLMVGLIPLAMVARVRAGAPKDPPRRTPTPLAGESQHSPAYRQDSGLPGCVGRLF